MTCDSNDLVYVVIYFTCNEKYVGRDWRRESKGSREGLILPITRLSTALSTTKIRGIFLNLQDRRTQNIVIHQTTFKKELLKRKVRIIFSRRI